MPEDAVRVCRQSTRICAMIDERDGPRGFLLDILFDYQCLYVYASYNYNVKLVFQKRYKTAYFVLPIVILLCQVSSSVTNERNVPQNDERNPKRSAK